MQTNSHPDAWPLVAPAVPKAGIEPEMVEVVALAFATLLDMILLSFSQHALVNLVSPLLLGIIASWGIWRLLRRSRAGVWTPLFATRAATVGYLAVGSLVTEFGGESLQELAQILYVYSPEEAAKVNTVFMTGFFILIASIKAASLIRPAPATGRAVTMSDGGTFKLALTYVIVGLGFSAFVYLPTQLDVFDFIIPGSIGLLFRALGGVGTFLMTMWAIRRGGGAYVFVAALVFVQVVLGLILMEKQIILMVVLLVSLAFLLEKASLLRICVVAGALGLTLAVASPAIVHARISHLMTHPDLIGGSVGERLSHYVAYAEGERLTWYRDEGQGATFVRLNYLGPAAFVISQYDYGMPSDTISDGLLAMVPRVIWPDKPIISSVGTNVNQMLTGSDTSAAGIAVFADVYWNFGWPGLLLFVPMGGFLWWASYRARDIIETRDWLMMPFVLAVFTLGMSVDIPFVANWLLPAIFSVMLLVVLRVGTQVMTPKHGGFAVAPVVRPEPGDVARGP